MHQFIEAFRQIARRRERARIAILVIMAMLGFGSASHFFAPVAAHALVTPSPTATPIVPEGPVLPPPPSPCAPAPAGPCPPNACTTDVPGASDYENSLPVPSPRPGFDYVVQLVNESDT